MIEFKKGAPHIVELPKINISYQQDREGFYTLQKPSDLSFLAKKQHWNFLKKINLYKYKGRKYYIPRTFGLNYLEVSLPEPDTLVALYPQQAKAVELLLQQPYGLMASGVGSGKTYMIASIAERLPVKPLIIAPKREIAAQLERNLKRILPHYRIKWIQKEKDITKDVEIAIMVQRSVDLYRRERKLDQHFPALLIDEIHMNFTKNRVELATFYKYKYFYWSTWTVALSERDDMALPALFANRVVNSGLRPTPPRIYTVSLPRTPSIAEDWHEKKPELLRSPIRNIGVLQVVHQVMQRPDRKMGIMFVDTVDYAKAMAWALNQLGIAAEPYIWEVPLEKRREILMRLTEKRGVMVATYQTAGVGFDHPPLNTAFYNMFVKFEWTVAQAVWRILRWAENPELWDFWEPSLYHQNKNKYNAYLKEYGNSVEIIKHDSQPNCALQYKMGLQLDEDCIKYKQLAEQIYTQYQKGNENLFWFN